LISKPNLDLLREKLLAYKKIVITGATGWLGSETSDLIAETLGPEFNRRVVLVGTLPKIKQTSRQTYQVIGWEDFKSMKAIDLLIHLAYLNQDKAQLIGLPRFIQANRSITADVNCVLSSSPGCHVLAASSGAASFYRGNVDSAQSMEVYAALKLEGEEILVQNSNIDALVNMRIWNVTGSGLDIASGYAVANFLKQALLAKHIVLDGNSASTRTYVDVKEMMFIFMLSLKSGRKITMDSGGYTTSLLDLASTVLSGLGLPRSAITLAGEFKSAVHYNPNAELFNQYASDLQLHLSSIDTQVSNYAKTLSICR